MPAATRPVLSVAPPVVMDSLPEDLSAVTSVPTMPPARRRVAVLAVHGMGQQVPFETLHAVAQTVVEQHCAVGGTASHYVARQVSVKDRWHPRVEVTLHAPGADAGGATAGGAHEVHFYEAYWAPLTEGEVRWWDVVSFLLGAAWRGLARSSAGFERWMFGRFVQCRLATWGRWHLALAAAIVVLAPCAGVLLAAYPAVALLTQLVTDGGGVWDTLLLTRLGLLCLLLVSLLATLASLGGLTSTFRYWLPRHEWRGGRTRSLVVLTLATLIALAISGVALAWTVQRLSTGPAADELPSWAHWIIAIAGGVAVLRARTVIVQYVGDVTAYVSSHSVSRFAEIRTAIQRVGRDIAHAIYGAQGDTPNERLYSEVVVLGHSLGSVVAYDVLNESIRRDWALASRGHGTLDVVQRTRRFITFGSPLDKTAFFFRTQKDDLVVREVLAAAVQPIIVSAHRWPGAWINIWSPWDWISGRLDYYDDPSGTRVVDNHVDDEASVWPGPAHSGYWARSRFKRALYDAVR
jgi:hypothetical protein